MPNDIKRHAKMSSNLCVCHMKISPPSAHSIYKVLCFLISKGTSFFSINKFHFYSYFILCLKIVKYQKMIVKYQKAFLEVPFDIKRIVLGGVYKR